MGQRGDERFIPAGAGNTSPGRWVPALNSGSSPQARGTPGHRYQHQINTRFIPAGAGNTPRTPARLAQVTVHPRRRGEHVVQLRRDQRPTGSSPQARGTPPARLAQVAVSRFIPAGAGNTPTSGAPTSDLPVHPRRRGEHAIRPRSTHYEIGSSPQARGTPRTSVPREPDIRFIPAGAGNTVFARTWEPCLSVHPRRRGEHVDLTTSATNLIGSSPQARGTLCLSERRC